jgi:hypothetical protein
LVSYQGFPHFAEQGQLEEAQARSNQQEKWFIATADSVAKKN